MTFSTIIEVPLLKRSFDIEQLKNLSPTPEGEGISFEEWAILDKDEVLSHTMARELGIVLQTRTGKAIFPETINEIADDIENGKGYNYRLPQPSVSVLETPIIGTDGKEKKWAVRNGNNRFELPYQEYPCAIISGEEYDLLRFGCTENNPDTWSKKNDNTDDDVKAMIQIGFECGKIEKNENAVREELEKNYPKVRNRSRERFISEILSSVGVKVSFQPYNKKTIATHLDEHFNLELGEDKDTKTLRVTKAWGRPMDDLRNTVDILKQCIDKDYSGWDVEVYSHLSTGKDGVTEFPNETNCERLRQEDEQYIKKFIRETCIPIVDKFRAGTLKLPTFHWVAQVNGKEKLNEFH